jgi:hypothetical protein
MKRSLMALAVGATLSLGAGAPALTHAASEFHRHDSRPRVATAHVTKHSTASQSRSQRERRGHDDAVNHDVNDDRGHDAAEHHNRKDDRGHDGAGHH